MTRMAISPRLATKRLRIRCEVAGFTLRFAVRCLGSPRARARGKRETASIIAAEGKRCRARNCSRSCVWPWRSRRLSPPRAASCRVGLAAARDAGYAILERGGSSLDAVTASVRTMEDDPQFNAGRGAVLNHEGDAELDAAIMDGHGPRAGAVAGVRHVRNPVELARLVMENSPHVLLVAEGAEEFALEQGVVLVPRGYFRTEARVRELDEARRTEAEQLKAAAPGASGTVGAGALDRAGHLAAATSTGGLTNKHHGRVGDSPIVGAGTYADDACAVSG